MNLYELPRKVTWMMFVFSLSPDKSRGLDSYLLQLIVRSSK